MRVLVTLFLIVAAVAAVPRRAQRIVGGSVTTIESYPTIVALLFSWDSILYGQVCAGSIINNRAILTAAHCTYGDSSERWKIRLGSTYANSGGRLHKLAAVIIHPSFNIITMDNDIAIMRTATPVIYSNVVKPASIAGVNYNLEDHQAVWAAGWGSISADGPLSEQLRHVQVWSINQDACRARYAIAGLPITDNMLCSGILDVGGRDQCQGDSGGPLYHNNVVVGICSFGIGCGHPQFPGVNARVSRFTSWIQSNA